MYMEKDREVKRQVRSDKRQLVDDIATQAEESARHQNMRILYGITKKLCNDEKPNQSAVIEDKDGKLIIGKEETMKLWNKNFTEILNREVPIRPITDEEVIDLGPPIMDINTSESSYAEIRSAIKKN